MSYSLELRFNRLPALQPDQHRNVYARNRVRKEWHKEVWSEVLIQGGKPDQPLTRAEVMCVRYSAARPDADNLHYSFKPLIDGLVRAHVLSSDDPSVLSQQVDWMRAPRGEGHVTIHVTTGDGSDGAGPGGPDAAEGSSSHVT